MTGAGVAVVTGASSGIGAATARHLAAAGFDLVLGARRLEPLTKLAAEIGGRALSLDVTSSDSVDRFCAEVGECRVLVNNAGGALGTDPVETADLDRWQQMYDTNVLGAVRMTKGLLPALEATGDGVVVMIGSIAGIEPYEGGAGYNAAKAGVFAMRQVLRYELLGRPVRVCEIDPGMAETEFSVVRFGGDTERAAQVYAGMTPLTADDIAECVTFAVTRPAHVTIDRMTVLPRDQASARRVFRRS